MALTDLKLRSLKGRDRPYKVSDSEGLYVLVSPNGTKVWRLAYRFNGKQKALALGRYPQTSLLQARRARDNAKACLHDGADSSNAKKAEKRKAKIAAGNTFAFVAEEWFASNKDRWVESYSSRLKSRLDADLIPSLGNRPIVEIDPLEVLDAIREIENRGAIEMAKRVMQMASEVFRYGVATARCSRDPTPDVRGALKPAKPVRHRLALPATEMAAFLKELEAYDGNIATKLAMKMFGADIRSYN